IGSDMRLCLVLADFPVLSQQFIARLFEGLINGLGESVEIVILVSNHFSEEEVEKFSPQIFDAIASGRVRVVSWRDKDINKQRGNYRKYFYGVVKILKNPRR